MANKTVSSVKNQESSKKAEKTAVKTEAVKAEVKAEPVKTTRSKGSLSVALFALTGKEAGEMELPKEVFGVEVNKDLLSQAMRVYQNNQKSHWSSTKTRGEVAGSTRKIYRQKGTGRARHGSIMAPIFVGGGIALGPKTRKTVLDLPKKMKKAALFSALSQKAIDGEVVGLSGLEKSTGKTKEFASFFKKLNEQSSSTNKKSYLVLVGDKNEMAYRSIRNFVGASLLNVTEVNAFEVIRHQSLILTKDAVEKLQERMSGEKVIKESNESEESKVNRRGTK